MANHCCIKHSEQVCDCARRVCGSNSTLLKTWLLAIEKNEKMDDTEVFQEAVFYCIDQSFSTAEVATRDNFN